MAVTKKIGGKTVPHKSSDPIAKLGQHIDQPKQLMDNKANAVVSVKEKKTGTEQTTHEVLASVPSTEPLCNVGTSAKYTKNLGNYESATISVSLNVPCKLEDIDKTLEFARGWVDARMEQAISELTS